MLKREKLHSGFFLTEVLFFSSQGSNFSNTKTFISKFYFRKSNFFIFMLFWMYRVSCDFATASLPVGTGAKQHRHRPIQTNTGPPPTCLDRPLLVQTGPNLFRPVPTCLDRHQFAQTGTSLGPVWVGLGQLVPVPLGPRAARCRGEIHETLYMQMYFHA